MEHFEKKNLLKKKKNTHTHIEREREAADRNLASDVKGRRPNALAMIFRCKISVVLLAIREGVGYPTSLC